MQTGVKHPNSTDTCYTESLPNSLKVKGPENTFSLLLLAVTEHEHTYFVLFISEEIFLYLCF